MGKPEGRRPLLSVDGGIMLNCILKKWDGARIGLILIQVV